MYLQNHQSISHLFRCHQVNQNFHTKIDPCQGIIQLAGYRRMGQPQCVYMVELHEAEKPIFAIIDTMSMSRQHLGLTTQFPSQGLG